MWHTRVWLLATAVLLVYLAGVQVRCASMRPLKDCPHTVSEYVCRTNGGVYLPFEGCGRCLRALERWDRCTYISQTSICKYPLYCDGEVCTKPDEDDD